MFELRWRHTVKAVHHTASSNAIRCDRRRDEAIFEALNERGTLDTDRLRLLSLDGESYQYIPTTPYLRHQISNVTERIQTIK